MEKIKELVNRWQMFDTPSSTDTFKKNNPDYLNFVDSNFGRDESGKLKQFIVEWGNDFKNL